MYDPKRTPVDPEMIKLRMGWCADGSLVACCYVEHEGEEMLGLVPGKHDPALIATRAPSNIVQHVLATETFAEGERDDKLQAAANWFEAARTTQPWIKRQ